MNILAENGPLALFFAFAIMHALADYPLQGEFLARVKQRKNADCTRDWLIGLTAHSLIHAGGVWLISGLVLFAFIEFVLHWLIDLGKGEGLYGYLTDQLLHLLCKLGFVVALVAGWGVPA